MKYRLVLKKLFPQNIFCDPSRKTGLYFGKNTLHDSKYTNGIAPALMIVLGHL